MAAIYGLSKQLAITMVATLNQAFSATTNPDGTFTGHWTDDGGYARTLTVRGIWSTEPSAYPQIAVSADPGPQDVTGAGGIVGMVNPGGGAPLQPKYGGILGRAEVRCRVTTFNEDEREQLTDQLRALKGGVNANGVRWWHVLQTTGFEPLWWDRNRYSEQRQDADPAHAVAYRNDLTLFARAQYVSVPTPLALERVTLADTLVAWVGKGAPLTI